MILLHLIYDIVTQGCIFSLLVMAVYLTSVLIRFDDLSVEGSFSTGGALTTWVLIHTQSPILALCAAFIGGSIIGIGTGILHTRLQINALISGLCMTTALFSINLCIAGAHSSLPRALTIFDGASTNQLLFGAALAAAIAVVFFIIQWFLTTRMGYLLTASGENETMVRAIGRYPEVYKTLTLSLANGLTALAGCLYAQYLGFFSITGNVGVLIIALSSLIIGRMFTRQFTLSLLLGSFVYQSLFAVIITFGCNPLWNNLIKAFFIVLLLNSRPKKEKGASCLL